MQTENKNTTIKNAKKLFMLLCIIGLPFCGALQATADNTSVNACNNYGDVYLVVGLDQGMPSITDAFNQDYDYPDVSDHFVELDDGAGDLDGDYFYHPINNYSYWV